MKKIIFKRIINYILSMIMIFAMCGYIPEKQTEVYALSAADA